MGHGTFAIDHRVTSMRSLWELPSYRIDSTIRLYGSIKKRPDQEQPLSFGTPVCRIIARVLFPDIRLFESVTLFPIHHFEEKAEEEG